MGELGFSYVTYIRTSPETLWRALTDAETTRRYWFDVRVESDWQVGSVVRLLGPDRKLWDHGEVLECQPHRRLSYTWITVMPELVGEPASRLTFELEPVGPEVKLTLTHDQFEAGSKLYESIGVGWPALLASLKSLLETGRPLEVVTRMMDSGELLPAPDASGT